MNDSLILAWTLGGPEILLLFLVVVLLFGAKKLPELARGLGKAKSEFQRRPATRFVWNRASSAQDARHKRFSPLTGL